MKIYSYMDRMHSCWPPSLHGPLRILFSCRSLAPYGILDALECQANLMALDCIYHLWKNADVLNQKLYRMQKVLGHLKWQGMSMCG